jgi:cell division protein FtsZ
MKGLDLSDASGVLVLISGATGTVKLSESKLAMNTIRAKTSRDALIVYGTSYDDKLGDQIRVTLVAAGFAAD